MIKTLKTKQKQFVKNILMKRFWVTTSGSILKHDFDSKVLFIVFELLLCYVTEMLI